MRHYGFSKGQILDFSVDVNPLGFPSSLRCVIFDHVDDVRYYPDPSAQAFREAISVSHDIPLEAILPGNGAAELIHLLARLRQVKRALIIDPTFGEYAWAMEQVGATIMSVHTAEANGFHLELTHEEWQRRLKDADLVFLCNPNNPTGVVVPRVDVLELAQRCRRTGTLLVLDESFAELLDDPEDASVVPDVMELNNVVVLRSLTKCFAIPGLRLGYVVASPSIVEDLRALQQPWPLNTFALAVGVQLCNETAFLVRSRQVIAELREELQRALSTVPGLQPLPSVTNFILCKLTTPACSSSELCERLARRGIIIRNCDSFPGLDPGRFVRLAVRTRADNRRLVQALRETL